MERRLEADGADAAACCPIGAATFSLSGFKMRSFLQRKGSLEGGGHLGYSRCGGVGEHTGGG